MPALKRPVNKKKKSFFARLIPTTRKAKIITFAAAFVVIGGGVMVYRSFAATTPDYTGGVMTWSFDGSRKYTNRVSSNGSVCAYHQGIDIGPSDSTAGRYYVTLFALVGGRWKDVKSTPARFVKNINRTDFDTVCWRGLDSFAVYRVQFDPTPDLPIDLDRVYARLAYKVYGYDKVNGQQGGLSSVPKNPPAPVQVSNPKPSK